MIRIILNHNATGYILAMRDSYMDMLDEPNSQTTLDNRLWDIWNSPDIWNRHQQDGQTPLQNPLYTGSDSNYVYVRVRNVGCAASPNNAGVLRLYWTKASTGEQWSGDWDGTISIAGAATNPQNNAVPAGGEITSGFFFTSIGIPALQPGQNTLLHKGWMPPNPADFYGSPTEVDACLLARIERSTSYPYGMTYPEDTSISDNVRNNNKIITRNMIIADIDLGGLVIPPHWFDFGNATARLSSARLELINDKVINPQLGGDFSAVGYAKLYLGSLYDRWAAGGMKGSGFVADSREKSVTFDGATTLVLDNISLNANERFPIKIQFMLRDSTADLDENQFVLHARQYDNGDTTNSIYGAVNFQVNTHPKTVPTSKNTRIPIPQAGNLTVYPNPAGAYITLQLANADDNTKRIEVYDMVGRRLIIKEAQAFTDGLAALDIKNLAAGMYIVKVSDGKGLSEQQKFVKE
jgi:hypothetical protein